MSMPCCVTGPRSPGQARHAWWYRVPQLWLVCACAAASILVLDKIVGFLWCPPELLLELLEELCYSVAWKNLPVLLSPHAEVFLACQYSSIKYFQLCMLLISIYSSGVKPHVQREWMSCFCSSCSAFTAGVERKHETSSLF